METEIRAPYHLQLAGTPQQETELRSFIQQAYQREFSAQIPHFLPILAGLYDADDVLIAACGLNLAGNGRLYLEHYLAQPVEHLLGQQLGVTARRSSLVEVGNLAAKTPGTGRLMFAAVVRLLHENGLEWVVFTGTAKLRNSFRHLHLAPVDLAEASADKVGSHAAEWGSYYHCQPRVMAGDLKHSRQALEQNTLLLPLFAPMPALAASPRLRTAS